MYRFASSFTVFFCIFLAIWSPPVCSSLLKFVCFFFTEFRWVTGEKWRKHSDWPTNEKGRMDVDAVIGRIDKKQKRIASWIERSSYSIVKKKIDQTVRSMTCAPVNVMIIP